MPTRSIVAISAPTRQFGDEGGMATTIGILPEFDPSRGSFTAFAERVQFFLFVNGETYALLRNLVSPCFPKEKTFEEIFKTLQAHF